MVDKKVVETRYAHDSWGITICCVASFAEAWIENVLKPADDVILPSPPSRRRGLKNKRDCLGNERKLASFAEAWIEKNGNTSKKKK